MQAFGGKSVELGGGLSGDQTDDSARPVEPPQHASYGNPYDPDDDTYCWVCEGPVAKRHCKIVCLRCGFTRDCSDP
jgi:hypothetical protein